MPYQSSQRRRRYAACNGPRDRPTGHDLQDDRRQTDPWEQPEQERCGEGDAGDDDEVLE
jgi:hypothetical protein